MLIPQGAEVCAEYVKRGREARGLEEGSVESQERGLVCGELLDAGVQQKWSELLAVAYLARRKVLAFWVWTPQRCIPSLRHFPPPFASIFGRAQPF